MTPVRETMNIQPKTPLIQRKKLEWMLLLVALALIGLLIVDVLVREFERIRSSESERLNVLTHVIASDIQENLAAANRALAGVINILDPQVIVFGGGLSNIGRLYGHAAECCGRHVFSDVFYTKFLPPSHGDSSGVRGAAWLWD